MTFVDDGLVAAVNRGGAAAADDRAAATCRAIAAAVVDEHHRLTGLLVDAGCELRAGEPPESLQRHELEFVVAPADAQRAVTALEHAGYEPAQTWRTGAERSFWRTAERITLLRSGPFTTVVQLRWRPKTPPSVLARLLRPTPADWAMLELPTRMWWAYSAIRPVRLVLERLGVRSDDHSALEPFLSTPTSLIGPLLDLAAVTSADVVADIGCGDGRLVIEAARRYGCRAIGVEQSTDLVRRARRDVERAGLDELVTIVHESADRVALDDVSVVVMFLPVGVATRLLPSILERMQLRPGSRVLLHEQSALPAAAPAPTGSTAVFTADALTVAHWWTMSSSDPVAAGSVHPDGGDRP